MDIKSVPMIPTYQINASTETSQERRQNGKNPQKRLGAKQNAPGHAAVATESFEPQVQEANLTSQIVDSATLVELLSESPSHQSSKQTFIPKVPSSSKNVKNTLNKINKTY